MSAEKNNTQDSVRRYRIKKKNILDYVYLTVAYEKITRHFGLAGVTQLDAALQVLSWTGPCNTPGPCNTRLIQPITINFSHSFCYIYKLYTAIIFSVKFETLVNVSIEDIVASRIHLA